MACDVKLVESKRIAAVKTLEELNRVDDLLTLAQDGVMWAGVRCAAAKALSRLDHKDEAVNILSELACAHKLSSEVRCDAAKALGELGRVDVAAEILLMLANDREVDAQVLVDAVGAVAGLGRKDQAISILLELTHNVTVEAWVRCDAAFKLADLGRKEDAIKVWLAVAQDGQSDVVCLQAAKALDLFGRCEEAGRIFSALVSDEAVDEWVRRDAAEALGQFTDANALPALEQIVRKDKSQDVRRAAQRAIEQIHQRTKHDHADTGTTLPHQD